MKLPGLITLVIGVLHNILIHTSGAKIAEFIICTS